jgi:TetR/AcrR family transcriptional regulator, regulator of autoinduction and epiphytic fitness
MQQPHNARRVTRIYKMMKLSDRIQKLRDSQLATYNGRMSGTLPAIQKTEISSEDGPPSKSSYHDRLREEKRNALMQAAMELFLEDGFERTSLHQIAKRAEVSTSTLFKHFPTKTALFEAIVTEYWELDEQYRYAPKTGNPKAGLQKIGDDYACLLTRPGMSAIFRIVIAEAPKLPELGRLQFQYGQEPFLKTLEGYLDAEVKAKTLRVPDTAAAAQQFLGMIAARMFWPRLLLVEFSLDEKQAASTVKEAVATMLARYKI